MVVQETEFILAGAARDMAEQGCQHLEAECQKLPSTYSGESSSILHYVSILSSCLIVNQLSLYRVAHKGALGLGGEGGCELKGTGDGQPAGSTNLLRMGSL